MAYSIFKHLAYNEWANTKFAEMLAEVDDQLFYQENKSSFPSIAKTVLHIGDAQMIWLSRMQGKGLTAWPSATFQGTKADALAGLVQSSKDINVFIKSKGESFLSTRYAYRTMKGDPFEDPVEDTLFHVVNHSTYHRGQITMMLREMNVTQLVGTDLIHYLRTVK
jgi:uncharacterized damage-inducible protein DinB